MNRFACPHCFADMLQTHSTEYLLESLVDGESLDGVLTSLMVIAEKKAQSQPSNKVTVNQWSRAARRLKELREWCMPVSKLFIAGWIMQFFMFGMWSCLYAYTPELYPTRARSTGAGFASAAGRGRRYH
jgi:hypothetical protein